MKPPFEPPEPEPEPEPDFEPEPEPEPDDEADEVGIISLMPFEIDDTLEQFDELGCDWAAVGVLALLSPFV